MRKFTYCVLHAPILCMLIKKIHIKLYALFMHVGCKRKGMKGVIFSLTMAEN
jgi:hypothetical protein